MWPPNELKVRQLSKLITSELFPSPPSKVIFTFVKFGLDILENVLITLIVLGRRSETSDDIDDNVDMNNVFGSELYNGYNPKFV